MWLPGTDPGSSGRAARALNHWAISPAPHAYCFRWTLSLRLHVCRASMVSHMQGFYVVFMLEKTLNASQVYNPQSSGGGGRRIKSSHQLQLVWFQLELQENLPISFCQPHNKNKAKPDFTCSQSTKSPGGESVPVLSYKEWPSRLALILDSHVI